MKKRPDYFTFEDFRTKIKPGTLIYPWFDKERCHPAPQWGTTDSKIETHKLLPFQAALRKFQVPLHTKQLQDHLNEWANFTIYPCAKVYRIPTSLPMEMGKSFKFQCKYESPVGLYLGEMAVVSETHYWIKLIGPNESIIWF